MVHLTGKGRAARLPGVDQEAKRLGTEQCLSSKHHETSWRSSDGPGYQDHSLYRVLRDLDHFSWECYRFQRKNMDHCFWSHLAIRDGYSNDLVDVFLDLSLWSNSHGCWQDKTCLSGLLPQSCGIDNSVRIFWSTWKCWFLGSPSPAELESLGLEAENLCLSLFPGTSYTHPGLRSMGK